jgi:P-type Cu2+ transporter
MQYSALDESPPAVEPDTAAATGGTTCFHCGEAVPSGVDLHAKVNARLQPVCCRGCQAVAEWIEGSGLNLFYEHRSDASPRPDAGSDAAAKWSCYDPPEVLNTLITRDGELGEINLWVDGLRCAACAWLVEKSLQQFPAPRADAAQRLARQDRKPGLHAVSLGRGL